MGSTDTEIEIETLKKNLEMYIGWDGLTDLNLKLDGITLDKVKIVGQQHVQTINLRVQEINNIKEKLDRIRKSSNNLNPAGVSVVAKRLLLLKDIDKNISILNENIDFAAKTSKDRRELAKELQRLQKQLEQNKTTEDERVKSSLETITNFAKLSESIINKKTPTTTGIITADSINSESFKKIVEQSEELGKILSKNVTTSLLDDRNTLNTKIANIESALSITSKNGVIAETAISKAISIIQEKVGAYNAIKEEIDPEQTDLYELTFEPAHWVDIANTLANASNTTPKDATASDGSKAKVVDKIEEAIEKNKPIMRVFKKDIQKRLSQFENKFQQSSLTTNNASDIVLYQRELLKQVYDAKHSIILLENALENPDQQNVDTLYRIFKRRYNTSIVGELELDVMQFSKNLLTDREQYEKLNENVLQEQFNELQEQFDKMNESQKRVEPIKMNGGSKNTEPGLVGKDQAKKVEEERQENVKNSKANAKGSAEDENNPIKELANIRMESKSKFKKFFSDNKRFMLKIRRKYNYMKKYTKVLIESDATMKDRIGAINKIIETLGNIANQVLIDMKVQFVHGVQKIMDTPEILTAKQKAEEQVKNEHTKIKMEKWQNNLSRIYKTPTLMDLILDSKFFSMYVLKIINFVLFVGALFMTEKIFLEKYMKNVYASNTDPPGLFIMILMLIGIHFMFVVFLVTVMYLLKSIYGGGKYGKFIIDQDLITAFLLDYLMFIVLLFIVIAMIGNIIQTKKYFRYKTEGLRGIRAFSLIILALAALFSLIPFFAF